MRELHSLKPLNSTHPLLTNAEHSSYANIKHANSIIFIIRAIYIYSCLFWSD